MKENERRPGKKKSEFNITAGVCQGITPRTHHVLSSPQRCANLTFRWTSESDSDGDDLATNPGPHRKRSQARNQMLEKPSPLIIATLSAG